MMRGRVASLAGTCVAGLVLAAAATGPTCQPPTDMIWSFCTHHKTGTVLLGSIIDQISKGLDQPVAKVDGTYKESHRESFASLADKDKTQLLIWKHVDIDSVDMIVNGTDQGKRLKVLVIDRDPVEIILSGYFYHRTTTEIWANTPNWPGFLVPFWDDYCRDLPEDDIMGIAACTVVERRNETLKDILNAVDAPTGVMIETARVMNELEHLRRSRDILAGASDVAMMCILDDLVRQFNTGFTEIFDFLEAPDVDACVRLASQFDITNSRKSVHAMDPTLTSMRQTLRIFLSYVPWFQANVEPLRIAMDLPPISPDGSTDASRPPCQLLT